MSAGRGPLVARWRCRPGRRRVRTRRRPRPASSGAAGTPRTRPPSSGTASRSPTLLTAGTQRPPRRNAQNEHSEIKDDTRGDSGMSAATVASTNTKRRVLVVDDEENVTHLVSSALRFDGFETVTADSGTAALAKVAETDPDLVVLD